MLQQSFDFVTNVDKLSREVLQFMLDIKDRVREDAQAQMDCYGISKLTFSAQVRIVRVLDFVRDVEWHVTI